MKGRHINIDYSCSLLLQLVVRPTVVIPAASFSCTFCVSLTELAFPFGVTQISVPAGSESLLVLSGVVAILS